MDDAFLQKVMDHNLDFMDDTPTTLRAAANTTSKIDKLFVAFVNYLIEDGWRYHPGNMPRDYDCSILVDEEMPKWGNCVLLSLSFARLAILAGVPAMNASIPQVKTPFQTPRIGSTSMGIDRVLGTPFVFSVFDGRASSGNVFEVDCRSRTVPVTTGRYILFAEHAITRLDLGGTVLHYDPLMVARYRNGLDDAVTRKFTQMRPGILKSAKPDGALMVYTGEMMPGGSLSKYVLMDAFGREEVIAYCQWCRTRGRKHAIPPLLLTELGILQHHLT